MRCPSARVAFCGGCSSAFLRFALQADSPRTGRNAGGEAAQNERGDFRSSELAEKLPRSFSRLWRALRPYPLRGTRPRTANRRHRRVSRLARPSAILAPSWIFEDAARTLRLGRENLSPRWGDFGDTTSHDDRTRGGALRFYGRVA